MFSIVCCFADVNLFHGKYWISFCCMAAVQILCLALAWMLHFLRREGERLARHRGARRFRPFCPSQWEILGGHFKYHFYSPGFFLLLALSAILKYHRSLQQLRPQRLYLALSILAAARFIRMPTDSPLAVLVAMMLVPRLEVIASYVGFGVMFIALYLDHYVGLELSSSPL